MKEVKEIVVDIEIMEESINRYTGSREGWELTKGSEVVVTMEGESISLFLAYYVGENEAAAALFSWESGVYIASGDFGTVEKMSGGMSEFLETELSTFLDNTFNDFELSRLVDFENLERIEKLIGKKPTGDNYPVADGVH